MIAPPKSTWKLIKSAPVAENCQFNRLLQEQRAPELEARLDPPELGAT